MSFWNHQAVAKTESGIEITDQPNDRPVFQRTYKARINGQVSLTIKIKFYGWTNGISTSGELTQSNGRWVLFEPERPADKILDREILPIIQKFCEEILALDRAFRKIEPKEFVDINGVKWMRA